MPKPPPTLDYQSPATGTSEERRSAALVARGTGGTCIIIGSLFTCLWTGLVLATVGSPRLRLNLADTLFVLAVEFYALSFLVCGILYVLAGARIRVPNRRWERVLLISASVHFLLVALAMLGLAALGTHTWPIIGFVIHLLILWRLGGMIFNAYSAPEIERRKLNVVY